MAIEIIKGDLVNAFRHGAVNFMAHCCNMQNVMGAGIARQIKLEYPQAFEADREWFLNQTPEFSHMSLARIDTNKYVANIYGQRYYGTRTKQLNEDYLRAGLTQLANITDWDDSIGLPYGMGCGLAGGDWPTVLKIVEEVFVNHGVKIFKLK